MKGRKNDEREIGWKLDCGVVQNNGCTLERLLREEL
jgi:hypothetical protein